MEPPPPKNLEELAKYPSYKERKYIKARDRAVAEGKQPPPHPKELAEANKGKKTKRGKPPGAQKKKKETLEEKRARRAKKKWTKEKADILLEGIRAKVPFEEIAGRVGKKKRYVIRRFKVQVLTLKRAGKTTEEIEAHFNMTENEIMDIIGKHPLPKPRPIDNKKRILENKEILLRAEERLARVEAKVDALANSFNQFLALFSAVDNFCEESPEGAPNEYLSDSISMLMSGFPPAMVPRETHVEDLQVNLEDIEGERPSRDSKADSDIELEDMRQAGQKLRFENIDSLYDHCIKYGNFKTALKKVKPNQAIKIEDITEEFERAMMGSQGESCSEDTSGEDE